MTGVSKGQAACSVRKHGVKLLRVNEFEKGEVACCRVFCNRLGQGSLDAIVAALSILNADRGNEVSWLVPCLSSVAGR
jgi:hypothetical protein